MVTFGRAGPAGDCQPGSHRGVGQIQARLGCLMRAPKSEEIQRRLSGHLSTERMIQYCSLGRQIGAAPFSETGGATALTGRGDDTSLGYSTLGLRAATSLDLQGMSLTLRGGLAWRHAFGDVDPKTTLAFAGSSAFTVAGLPIAKDAALVEAGLDLAISQSATLGLSYTGQLAQDAQDHAFKGVLAVRF